MTIAMPPPHPAADEFPLLDPERLESLAADIRTNGQRSPCVTWRGQLLDGRNRWKACAIVGVDPLSKVFEGSEAEAIGLVISANLERRHLLPIQHSNALNSCLRLQSDAIAAANRERMREAGKLGGEKAGRGRPADRGSGNVATTPKPGPEKKPTSGNGDARRATVEAYRPRPKSPDCLPRRQDNAARTVNQVAAAAGMAPRAMRDVQQATRDRPDVKEAIKVGAVTTFADAKKLAKLPEPERKQAIAAVTSGQARDMKAAIRSVAREGTVQRAAAIEPPSSIDGPFAVIVADPPWTYDKRAEDGTHRAALPYTSMTIDEIRGLPMPPLCPDAVLWLWTTNAHIEHSFGIARAWGFERIPTVLTWVKDRMGTGDWLRGQTEHCLVCVRGRPLWALTNQTTVINGPLRAHSQKPESFFDMVDKLCPDPRRLELFSRQSRNGWIVWGADASQ